MQNCFKVTLLPNHNALYLCYQQLLDLQKASQGDMSELFCQMPINIVPDPNISGLDPSERMLSIYSHCKAFLPHLKRVTEQQRDLQPPSSHLLNNLTTAQYRTSGLANQINCIYQTLFPNLPIPLEPVDGPTSIHPSQNVFQQKVYGCVVLKNFKELLSQIRHELRILMNQMCKSRTFAYTNALFWGQLSISIIFYLLFICTRVQKLLLPLKKNCPHKCSTLNNLNTFCLCWEWINLTCVLKLPCGILVDYCEILKWMSFVNSESLW